jgi:hypothetical protein
MREHLTTEMDLGILALMALFGRRPRRAEWALEVALRHMFSLWYAFFGAPAGLGPFCGAPVEAVYSAGPSWAPVGLTLLVNQFAGQLFFQTTSVPESVPASGAEDFLDILLADLGSEASSWPSP